MVKKLKKDKLKSKKKSIISNKQSVTTIPETSVPNESVQSHIQNKPIITKPKFSLTDEETASYFRSDMKKAFIIIAVIVFVQILIYIAVSNQVDLLKYIPWN